MAVDFGAPVLSWHDTTNDGTMCWAARWQAYNNDGASIAYWNSDLQGAMADKIVSIDRVSVYMYTVNAVTMELYMYGKNATAEPIPIFYTTTTAGEKTREEYYGPWRPIHTPVLGATNYAAQLAVYAGGNAADDYDLSVYGRAWSRAMDADAPVIPQPVDVHRLRVWPWG